MQTQRWFLSLPVLIAAWIGWASGIRADIGNVFVIAMENHNFTQPEDYTGTQAILGNANAPFINSLITVGNANAAQTSWASKCYNVAGIHPSEPNYIWAEAGTNFGIQDDNDPYWNSGTNAQSTNQHLSGLLQVAGISWKSYQEDIDLNLSNGQVLAPSQWTVPLSSFSGSFGGGATPNPYNGSLQYDYACKHNPQVFFTDTNGGNNSTPSNPQVSHYAPLQRLQTDLSNNTVARFNWITPNQLNDMHTELDGGFTYHGTPLTGDSAQIAQGDNFLSIVVPQIMASQAYQNNGLIMIWFDETEGADTTDYTLPYIVISPLAKGNAYQSTVPYSHSSDLRTLQEIFQVAGTSATGYLGDAANVFGQSDMFQAGVIASTLPVSKWTGGGTNGLWSTAQNWTTALANGNSLVFSGTSQTSTSNDVLSSAGGIAFDSTAGTFTLSGNDLTISGGIANHSTHTQTVNLNLTLSAAQQFVAADGNLIVAGTIANGGNTLTVAGSSNATLAGSVSGNGALAKIDAGTLTVTGNNSYSGGTRVDWGTLVIGDASALGSGGLTINDTAVTQLQAGLTAPVQLTSLTIGSGSSLTAGLDVADDNIVLPNDDLWSNGLTDASLAGVPAPASAATSVEPVPEPSTLFLAAIGGVSAFGFAGGLRGAQGSCSIALRMGPEERGRPLVE